MPATPVPFAPRGNISGASTGTLYSVSQSAALVQKALDPSAERNGATFYNDTNVGNAYIAFGVTASLAAFTCRLLPSGSWSLPSPAYCGPVYVAWDAAGAGALRVTEQS